MVEIHRLSQRRLVEILEKAKPDQRWVLDTETNGLDVVGHCSEHWAWWIGLSPVGTTNVFIISRDEYDEWDLERWFKDMHFVGHNLRFDLHALELTPVNPWYDTMVAAYYGHTGGKRSMDHIALVYGWDNIPTPDALKNGRIASMDEGELFRYLANDCVITSKMFKRLQVDACTFDYRVEQAVYSMECRGIRLLADRFDDLVRELDDRIYKCLTHLRRAGLQGNPDSPMQVASWLKEQGRTLPKTATGKVSTAKLVLQRLADDGDELAEGIINYRKVVKLQTAFAEPLPRLARDGILYPRTNTTRTLTGRFSCDSPNLQQIPKRGPLGKAMRGCMTSPENNGITACDFSQVELRVAAALADEPVLLEAFAEGRCPHTEVAAKMLGKLPAAVTPEERFSAKAVNFGILNGMGANRLALELKSSKFVASRFLLDYKRGLPRLNQWMEGVWRDAEAFRVARTVGGRTRIFTSIDDTRPAISVIVQGSAAELMRHALVAAHDAGLSPLLSVHDEVLIGGDDPKVAETLREVMESSANSAYTTELGAVNFKAEASTGVTWGDV
jgi:DNA polymerase I-like protein with 3'-5' exonuclease and polymerase domains